MDRTAATTLVGQWGVVKMQITRQRIFTTHLGHRQLSLYVLTLFLPCVVLGTVVFGTGNLGIRYLLASRLVTEPDFCSANNNRWDFHPFFFTALRFDWFHFDTFLERAAMIHGTSYLFFFPRAGMNMAAITKAIPEMSLRQWLNDVLINLLRMWEYNMW